MKVKERRSQLRQMFEGHSEVCERHQIRQVIRDKEHHKHHDLELELAFCVLREAERRHQDLCPTEEYYPTTKHTVLKYPIEKSRLLSKVSLCESQFRLGIQHSLSARVH